MYFHEEDNFPLAGKDLKRVLKVIGRVFHYAVFESEKYDFWTETNEELNADLEKLLFWSGFPNAGNNVET